jgi:hypothetical protein
VTDDKSPIEEAVDQALSTFVYAPIGLLFDGPARFPKLVRNGRSQVANARMMGQFAVKMGRSEVTKRATELDGPVIDLLRGLGVIDGPPTGPAPASPEPVVPVVDVPGKPAQPAGKQGSTKAPAARKPATKAAAKKVTKKRAAKKAAAGKAPAPTADALPITDYDSLSASQVVSRLQGLSTGELEAVRAYEAGTRGRKTILNRVQQLLKP